MAYSISERELRRLRRERFIEDQERQRRLEEEIQLLQRQRDQYVVDQRYRRALNRLEPERDLEEQFSDDGLQMTLDRWSDTSAFETDTDVRQREASYTQNPRKDVETQYETTDTLVRNDNREDERIGQQGLKERERIRKPDHAIQDRYSIRFERNSRNATANDCDRNSKEGNLPWRQLDSPTNTTLNPNQNKEFGNESLPRDSGEREANRAAGSTEERKSSEREQGVFMSVVDREIENLEKRLQTMRSSCSEVLEKSKERVDSSTTVRKLKTEERLYVLSGESTDRDSFTEKRMTTESDREYVKANRMGSICKGIKGKSAQKGVQREWLPGYQSEYSEYSDRMYDPQMITEKDESKNKKSKLIEESYEKDVNILKINSEIEKLLQLRRKLEEEDIERIGTERRIPNIRMPGIDKEDREYLHQSASSLDNILKGENERNVQHTGQYMGDYGRAEVRYQDRHVSVERGGTTGDNVMGLNEDFSFEPEHIRIIDRECEEKGFGNKMFQEKESGTEALSCAEERQKQIEISRKENVNTQMKTESFPSNVKFDEAEEEKCLFEGRKKKESLLKEMERVLKEKEKEISDRERRVQEKERERERQLNPYEELLKEKERMIEQKFKELKEREEQIKEREKRLSDDNEPQRTTIQRSTPEVQQNQKEVLSTEIKQDSEKETEANDRNKERDKRSDTEMKTEFHAAKVESEKTDAQSAPTLNTNLDKTFYYSKFSIFSGEDPLPKTESTFEEWKYEVNCLRRDKIYSDTVIGQAIRKSLKGQAKKVLLPMGSEATVTDILERLEGVFGNVATPMSILQEFYSVSQKIDESVAAWGLRLEEILQKAIEKGQVRREDRDEMLRNKFWRSLRNEKLKMATRIDFQTIKSFDLLRKKVCAEEYEMKVNTGVQHQAIYTERKTDTAETPESKMDLLLQRLSSLETQMKEMNKRRQGRFNYRQLNQRQNQNQNTTVKSAAEQPNKQQSGTPLN